MGAMFTTGGGATGAALQAALRPGEQLRGTLLATRRTGLKISSVAVGVTETRMIVAPVSGKGETLSLERGDITGSSAKGLGMDWRKLAGSNVASVRLNTRSHGEVKLSIVGDDIPGLIVGSGPSSGIAALQEFLASAPG